MTIMLASSSNVYIEIEYIVNKGLDSIQQFMDDVSEMATPTSNTATQIEDDEHLLDENNAIAAALAIQAEFEIIHSFACYCNSVSFRQNNMQEPCSSKKLNIPQSANQDIDDSSTSTSQDDGHWNTCAVSPSRNLLDHKSNNSSSRYVQSDYIRLSAQISTGASFTKLDLDQALVATKGNSVQGRFTPGDVTKKISTERREEDDCEGMFVVKERDIILRRQENESKLEWGERVPTNHMLEQGRSLREAKEPIAPIPEEKQEEEERMKSPDFSDQETTNLETTLPSRIAVFANKVVKSNEAKRYFSPYCSQVLYSWPSPLWVWGVAICLIFLFQHCNTSGCLLYSRRRFQRYK